MGKCFSKLNLFKKRKKIKLMIIGLNKAGKTTLIKHLCKETCDNIAPTNGFACTDMKKYKNFDVLMYDLGGGDTIRKIWNNYFGLVHGIIFVIDSVDIERLGQVKQCLNDTISNCKVSGKPILIFVNKQDLNGALDEMEIYKELELKDLINRYQCPTKVEACSIINNWNKKVKSNLVIDENYHWLLEHIIKNWSNLQSRVEKETAEQTKSEKEVMEQRIQKYRNTDEIDSKLENCSNQTNNQALSNSANSQYIKENLSSKSELEERVEKEKSNQILFDKILEENVFSMKESKSLLEKIQHSIQPDNEQKKNNVKIRQDSPNFKRSNKFFKIRSKSLKNLLLKQNKITPLPSYTYSRPKSR